MSKVFKAFLVLSALSVVTCWVIMCADDNSSDITTPYRPLEMVDNGGGYESLEWMEPLLEGREVVLTFPDYIGDIPITKPRTYEQRVRSYDLPYAKLLKLGLLDLPDTVLEELSRISASCEKEIEGRLENDKLRQSLLIDEEIDACLLRHARKKDLAVSQYTTENDLFSRQFVK